MDYISKNNFKNIYLCGIYTDVCIIKASMDGFDLGLNIKVVENCCASLHSKNHHKMAINTIKHIIGENNVFDL